MTEATFGRRILGVQPETVLALELRHSPASELHRIDTITNRLVLSSLSGERLVEPYEDASKPLVIRNLSPEDRSYLASRYALEVQESRGAWFLPDEIRIAAGLANLPHNSRAHPRFAISASYSDVRRVVFRSSPEAVFFWAVLEPLFAFLFRPFELRGPSPAAGDPDVQKTVWDEIRRGYAALGFTVEVELEIFEYGGGWGQLASSEQIAARGALLNQLRVQGRSDIASRIRIQRSRELIEKYYAKAKRSPPEMRKVLTKPLQRTLSGCFAGDWAALLTYLGEDAASAEEIPKSLPEGPVPFEPLASEPVQRRLSVLRAFWTEFDSVHGRQAPGMPSLWGFIEENELISLTEVSDGRSGPEWFHPSLYLRLLPRAMLSSIDELWDGFVLSGYPEAIVTTVNPYARMCQTLGPALNVWNGIALTAWFISEGPYSRTDIAGLAEYFSKDLKALQELETPVDTALFEELRSMSRRLGEPEPFKTRDTFVSQRIGGFSISAGVSAGSRRSGFELLRDVITRYRRSWSQRSLVQYLERRCEAELARLSREYGKQSNAKGKPPTLKQFVKQAGPAANSWFGGDLSHLYAALGLQCSIAPARRRLLARPVRGFVLSVFTALGGKPTRWEDLASTIKDRDRVRQDIAWRNHENLRKLSELSIGYVQLLEALNRPPSLKEFGAGKFAYVGTSLDSDVDRAWARFAAAIEDCLHSLRVGHSG